MSSVLLDFVVQALAGITGVFLGVWMALVLERKRSLREKAQREAEQQEEYARARHTVLGSVVKNTNEATRLRRRIDQRKAYELIHPRLEVSVWDAIQAQFMQACTSVDERVRFAQFFDGVRNLQAFFEFHRDLLLSKAGAFQEHDPELEEILTNADIHLRELAEDQRFNGVLLITDFGEPVHKKLMGQVS